MILHGPSIQKQAENKSTQATLTISQLLQFNSYVSNRSGSSHHDRHNRYRETPKRELVDDFFKLGISVSYDQILSISTDVGNTICRKFQDENLVCPLSCGKAYSLPLQ